MKLIKSKIHTYVLLGQWYAVQNLGGQFNDEAQASWVEDDCFITESCTWLRTYAGFVLSNVIHHSKIVTETRVCYVGYLYLAPCKKHKVVQVCNKIATRSRQGCLQ